MGTFLPCGFYMWEKEGRGKERKTRREGAGGREAERQRQGQTDIEDNLVHRYLLVSV